MTPKAQARVLVRAYEGGAFTDLGEPLAKGTLGAVQLFSRSGREMVGNLSLYRYESRSRR